MKKIESVVGLYEGEYCFVLWAKNEKIAECLKDIRWALENKTGRFRIGILHNSFDDITKPTKPSELPQEISIIVTSNERDLLTKIQYKLTVKGWKKFIDSGPNDISPESKYPEG